VYKNNGVVVRGYSWGGKDIMEKKEVIELLEKCGVKVPLIEKFDLSGIEEKYKAHWIKFLTLIDGDPINAIYVKKECTNGMFDPEYYSLLYTPDTNGEPIAVPVPLARRIFGVNEFNTRNTISGFLYERIYSAYYQNREIPF
jgi:hypothetical protein